MSTVLPPGRIGVVLNPHARKNRRNAEGRADRLRRVLGPYGEVRVTASVEDVRPTVAELEQDGATVLVCDGGDGTLHQVLNAAWDLATEAGAEPGGEAGEAALPVVAPTIGGTIDFVAHKAGTRGRAAAVVGALARAARAGRATPVVTLDSLVVAGTQRGPDGEDRPFRRLGFALAAGGVGQRFFAKYYAAPKPGPRTIVEVVSRTVASLTARKLSLPASEAFRRYSEEVFAPTLARVTIDGSELPYAEYRALNAGAFDVSLGGVFRVFPLARAPGVLEFHAGAMTPLEVITSLPDLARGRPIETPDLVDVAGREMTVEATGDELLAPILDGERYTDLHRITVRRGPPVRVARVRA